MQLAFYEFEYFYQYILGSKGFQETHMDALNQFSSKLMTLTLIEGLWTFLAILALCAAIHYTYSGAFFNSPHANNVLGAIKDKSQKLNWTTKNIFCMNS